MKFNPAVLLTVAATVSAVALPEPAPAAEAEPWCWRPGQSCWKKAKREAESTGALAALEAREASAAPEPWCWRPGQSCWKSKAKRAPVAEPWCWRPGQSCWKAKAKRDAEPDAEASPWCWRPGQSCWKAKAKRDAEAAPAPEAEAEASAEPWCWRPGQSCWKVKRAADAFAEALASAEPAAEATPDDLAANTPGGASFFAKRAVDELAGIVSGTQDDPEAFYAALALGSHFFPDTPFPFGPDDDDSSTGGDDKDDKSGNEKRDAAADAEPEPWCWRPGQSCWKAKVKRAAEAEPWCWRPGQSCWKAKRAAEALISSVGDMGDELYTRDFAPGERVQKRDADADANAEPWCWRPGQSCWKAKRDLHAMVNVARDIVESF